MELAKAPSRPSPRHAALSGKLQNGLKLLPSDGRTCQVHLNARCPSTEDGALNKTRPMKVDREREGHLNAANINERPHSFNGLSRTTAAAGAPRPPVMAPRP